VNTAFPVRLFSTYCQCDWGSFTRSHTNRPRREDIHCRFCRQIRNS